MSGYVAAMIVDMSAPADAPRMKTYRGSILSFAFCVATRIDPWLIDVVGSSRWLRLAAWGFVVAVSLELVGLPLAFWSSFVLEKRYDGDPKKMPYIVNKEAF